MVSYAVKEGRVFEELWMSRRNPECKLCKRGGKPYMHYHLHLEVLKSNIESPFRYTFVQIYGIDRQAFVSLCCNHGKKQL